MPDASTTPTPLPIIDAPQSADIFSTDATGFTLLGGNVAITLDAMRTDYSQSPPKSARYVIGRIVLPISGAQGLVVGLNNFLEQHGLSPSQAVGGDATKQ